MQVDALLGQAGPLASFTADGTSDQDGVHGQVALRCPERSVVIPPHSSAVRSNAAQMAPTIREHHLQTIADRGRMVWQKTLGCHWRALAKADISRSRRIVGDCLQCRVDRRQATEVGIAASALDRMLELGRPGYIRFP